MAISQKNKSIISIFLCVVMALALFFGFVAVKEWLLSNYRVMQSSMEPTLEEGDIVWANKVKDADYGDIVLVEVEENRTKDVFIKRVVAFGGDLIWVEKSEMQENSFYLCRQKKDSAIEEKLIKENYDGVTMELMGYSVLPTREDGFVAIGKENAIEVPANHVYCIGDNRNNSYDSRKMGAFSQSDVIGVVVGKGMGVFWAIAIPLTCVFLALGLLTYFPFDKKKLK